MMGSRQALQPLVAPSIPTSLPFGLLLIAVLIALSPAAAAAQRRDVSAAGPRIHWVPAEGLSHPVFESAGPGDMIEAYLTFGPPWHPGPDLAARLAQPLRQWRQLIAGKIGKEAVIKQQGHRRTVSVEVSGVDDPMSAVGDLVRIYRDSQLPLSEVFLLRRQIDANGIRSDPLPDPRMPEVKSYSDSVDLWNAMFDPAQPLPNSEDPFQQLSAATFPGGELLYEIRGTPIFFDDLRVAYGTPDVEVVEADGRSLEVAGSLRRHLRKAFPRASAPPFINTDGDTHRVIKLKNGPRIGYSFAFFRNSQKVTPFEVRFPAGYRYREYELLSGIRAAIQSLDLEPVIFWNRGSRYIFYLWERLPQTGNPSP